MRFYIVSLLLLLHYTLFAQAECTLSISGSVLDEHDKQALALAQVYIPSLHIGTVVDSAGNYTLDGLCPGVYEIVASHIGCLPVYRKISLSHSISNFNFYPEHHTTELEEVQLNKPKTTTPKQVELSLTDLLPAKLRLLQTGQNVVKPILQGFSGNRITVIKQGVSIQDQQWGSDHSLSLMVYPDDQLQINEGSAAHFGTLLFAPNNPFDSKATFFSSGYSNGWGATIGGLYNLALSKNAAIGVRTQLKKNGDLHTPDYLLANTAGQAANAQLDFAIRHNNWQFTAGGGYNLQDLGVLRASHTGNATDFARALAAEQPLYTRPFSYTPDYPKQFAQHLSFSSKAEKSFTKQAKRNIVLQHKLAFFYTYQHNTRREFDIRRGGNSNVPALNLQLQTHSAGIHYTTEHAQNGTLQLSANQHFSINTNIEGTGFAPVLPNYNQYQTALNADYSQQLGKHNTLQFSANTNYTSIRAQFFEGNLLKQPLFHFFTLGASAMLTHTPASPGTNLTQLHTILSVVQRAPAANELLVRGVHHGTASIEQGNENLHTETKIGLEQTILREHTGLFSLKISAYGNYIHQYIYQIPLAELRQTIRGAFPVFEYTQTNALFSGLEFNGRYALTKRLAYISNLNFIYAQDLNRKAALPLIPPFQWENELRFEENINELWQNGFVSVGHRYTGRQFRYVPALDLAPPPADYSLFNASIGISRIKKRVYTFSLTAENLGNHAYRNYLDRFRYFADAPGISLFFKCLINF